MAKKNKANSPKDKEQVNLLKKLNRTELLELLIEQTQRADDLELQLKEAKEQLKKREIIISNAGSLAEAALNLNEIFEAADKAAQQYLDNIKHSSPGTAPRKQTGASSPGPASSGKTGPSAPSSKTGASGPSGQAPTQSISVEKLGTFIAGPTPSARPAQSTKPAQTSKPAQASKPAHASKLNQTSKPMSPATAGLNKNGVRENAISLDIAEMIASGKKPSAASKSAKPAVPKSSRGANPASGGAATVSASAAKPAAPKSTIPFKSSLAPANKQPAKQASKSAGIFGPDGMIDVAKIFENN